MAFLFSHLCSSTAAAAIRRCTPRSESQKELELLSSRRTSCTTCTKNWSFHRIKTIILSYLRPKLLRSENPYPPTCWSDETCPRGPDRFSTLRASPDGSDAGLLVLELSPSSLSPTVDEASPPLCRYDHAMQGHTMAQLEQTVQAIQENGVEPEPCAGYRLAEVLLRRYQMDGEQADVVAGECGRPRLLLFRDSDSYPSRQAKRVEPGDEDGYFVGWNPPD
ncbi:hypothetical protein M406DRAFT_75984 [Cryphonectria parasitica EP155]|uniref:Uncharacterized protein n=1 Tax=Cryphonectria parasitica (strain ATCC 38755 / EP155) TaxID=660469 RepID=A0A9P4XSX8_CRYP1|nr:uncharacterized protein M406DRAFT_75984 [Cryphonectria parasitica EP155]KAF3760321.1 hypothetical protein M406DRAFT_75984 [Cryphonectria parasitica EP155]